MSPSVAIKFPDDAPVSAGHAFAFGKVGNNNQTPIKTPRRSFVRIPMPPVPSRDLSQRIQAADEFWHELWKAHCSRNSSNDGSDDAALLVSFACFIHAVIDDKNLCGQVINYLNEKLEAEFADRQEPVNP